MSRLVDTLPKTWPSFTLPGCRVPLNPAATYSGFLYEDLPPVEVPDDRFRWLEDEPPREGAALDADAGLKQKLLAIEASADFTLPAPFVLFLRSPELRARVRSITACYWEMPDFIVPTVGPEEGRLIHFLSDQQWCMHWSLYVSRDGQECVLCSTEAHGFDGDEPGAINPAESGAYFCAPSFSEFVYRFWIENEVWLALVGRQKLTKVQQAYVDHYRPLGIDRRGNMKRNIRTIWAGVTALLGGAILVGCGGGGSSPTAMTPVLTPRAVSAALPDGLTATLAEDRSAIAVGGVVTYTLTLTNATAQPITYHPIIGGAMPSGGVPAALVVKDAGGGTAFPVGPMPDLIGIGPNTRLAPGQSVSGTLAVGGSDQGRYSAAGQYSASAFFAVQTGTDSASLTTTVVGPLPVDAQ